MTSRAFHDGKDCATGEGQKRSEAVSGIQHTLTFFRNLQRIQPPKPAPAKLVRQCQTARQAMRVALKAVGMKRLLCARLLGVSESYVCRLVNERQPMPEWFVPAFCWATKSTLLQQWIDAQDDSDNRQDERLAAMLREAA